jgi:hypothetical protein
MSLRVRRHTRTWASVGISLLEGATTIHIDRIEPLKKTNQQEEASLL